MENLMIVLISILGLVALVAALILFRALFPIRVEKVKTTLETNWKRSFWLGLVNTVLITIIVIGLSSLGDGSPVFYIPSFALYGFYLIGLLFGLSAFNLMLGERLFSELSPVKRDVRAGTVWILSSLLPFVGWFLLFPYILSLSIGAVVITLFQNRKRRKKEEQEDKD